MQVVNLMKMMKDGKVLNSEQELRVKNYIEAKKQKETPINNKKRGRNKKAIVPRGTPFTTMHDAQTAVVNEAKLRLQNNKPLANHHARALRDAWLLEMHVHIWPTLAAAAADLKISVSTMRNFAEEGCPFEPHSPIAKAPVLSWLLHRAHERGGARGATTDDLEQIELQWRQAKLNKLNESLVAQAEDRAHQGVISTMSAVRHHLQHVLPGAICDIVASANGDRIAAEEQAIKLIENELRRLEPTKTESPTHAQHQ